MNLKDQVVSLKLAKRLKEFGVKQESLYGWCLTNSKLKHNEVVLTCAQAINHSLYNCHLQKETYVSAFTVAELGNFLNRCASYRQDNKLYICIMFYVPGGYRQEAETEADARAKMLIYLLENGLIENDLL